MKAIRLALMAFAAIGPASLSAQDPAVSAERAPQTAPQPMSRQKIAADMGRQFDRHDTDHDGYLSWQEWEESNSGSPGFGAKTVFDHMDRDHDMRLARQEMIDWSHRIFDCVDENRDGTITRSEKQTKVQFCMMAETGVVPQ